MSGRSLSSGGKSKTARALVTWRYLANRKVKHAVPVNTMWYTGHDPISLCGIIIVVPDQWRGTGSQEEYDTVDSLPECKRCTALLGPTPKRTDGKHGQG